MQDQKAVEKGILEKGIWRDQNQTYELSEPIREIRGFMRSFFCSSLFRLFRGFYLPASVRRLPDPPKYYKLNPRTQNNPGE